MIEEREKGPVKMNDINDLPDHFLINIFEMMNLRDRLKMARVCKKWNTLVKDASLWFKIDLTPYKFNLSLNMVKSILNTYANRSTRELIVSGHFFQDARLIVHRSQICSTNDAKNSIDHIYSDDDKRPLCYLDKSLMQILELKCSKLKYLKFEYLDLTKLDRFYETFHSFSSLKNLEFKWCNINENWFDINHRQDDHDQTPLFNLFSNLTSFYLTRTVHQLNRNDIENICLQMPNLTILSITQNQSTIKDDSIEFIVKHLKQLKELDLVNTKISDEAIFKLCESNELCQKLERLNLCLSSSLSNNSLHAIGSNLINLKKLYLTSCFGISNVNLFQNLSQLIYLNLNNTSIDKNDIKSKLIGMLPQTEIEYGHEKIVNRKLMWTINGSRNSVCSF